MGVYVSVNANIWVLFVKFCVNYVASVIFPVVYKVKPASARNILYFKVNPLCIFLSDSLISFGLVIIKTQLFVRLSGFTFKCLWIV